MANLETLELTINANAESASKGLARLSRSLTTLSKKLTEPISQLSQLNTELAKLNTLTSSSSANKISVNASSAVSGYRTLKAETQGVSSGMKSVGQQTRSVSTGLTKVGQSASDAGKKSNGFLSGLKNLKSSISSMLPKFNLLNRVLRVASTMLIRLGVKALFNGVKEGFQNFYHYASATGNAFATQMDSVYSSWTQIKNQLGASLATAFSAAIPVIQSLASACITAFNYLSQLIALLTGSSTWTKATEQVSSYGDAIDKTTNGSGGSGGLKELLADFDELNVITSESSGGGGSSSAAEDYENMFEEITEFDETIRAIADFVKEVVGWIEEHINSILGIVAAIGVAILAWKISSSFAEVLPTLSKIAGWVATGAVIAITAQITWDLINKYLQTGNEGWLITDFLTTAIGATAAGLIAKQLIGGKSAKWAASIALTVSAVTEIVALMGNKDVDALSKESILTAISSGLKLGAGAGLAASALGASVLASVLIAAGVAFATVAVVVGVKAYLQSKSSDVTWGNVHLTQEEIQEYVNKNYFTVDVPVVTKLVAETIDSSNVKKEEIQTELIKLLGDMKVIKLGIADADTYSNLKTEVDNIVTKIGEYVEIAKREGKLTLQLTPTLVGDTEEEQADWYSNFTSGWDKVNEWATAKGTEIGELLVKAEAGEITAGETDVLNALLTQLSNVTNAVTTANINSSAFSDLVISLNDLDESSLIGVFTVFDEYKEQLTSSYNDLTKEMYVKQGELVAALYNIDPNSEEYKNAYNDWVTMGEKLATAGTDAANAASQEGYDYLYDWLLGKVSELYGDEITSNIKKYGADHYNAFKSSVETSFKKGDTESLKSTIQEYVDRITDVDPVIIKAKDVLDITGWEFLAEEQKQLFFSNLYQMIGVDAVAALKDALNISASEMINISGWDTFSTYQKLEFIRYLSDAYGSSAALSAAKQCGIDVVAAINEGLASDDASTKKEAQALVNTINEELENVKDVKIDASADLDVKVNAIVEVEAQTKGTSVFSKVATAVSDAKTKITNWAQSALGNATKATGAYDVPTGDLFIANEQGAELVGSLNGKTTVANQEQIVEGIQRGVAEANSEQNSLLRQQNELLRGILYKDSSVRIGASAALGRTVQQSLDMYSKAVGV